VLIRCRGGIRRDKRLVSDYSSLQLHLSTFRTIFRCFFGVPSFLSLGIALISAPLIGLALMSRDRTASNLSLSRGSSGIFIAVSAAATFYG
jgi:hypothetical protein